MRCLLLLSLLAALLLCVAGVSPRVASLASQQPHAGVELTNAELVDSLEEAFLEMRMPVLAEMESEAHAETEAEAEAESESELLAELEAEMDAEAEADSETDAETDAETEVDAEADAEEDSLAELSAANANTVSILKLKDGYQTYGHGAVMGAAWAFAKDSKWALILQTLQPGEYAKMRPLAQQVQSASSDARRVGPVGKMMLLLENNPVLAAYATMEHMKMCTGNAEAAPSACRNPLRHEWDIFLKPGDAANVGEVRISHGNTVTTVTQAVFSSSTIGWRRAEVVSAPGGTQWLELFGKAINMAKRAPTPNFSNANAVTLAASYLSGNGGLILDVKSTYSTSADLDALVAALRNQFGINIIGVGSFIRQQVDPMRSGVLAVHFYQTHYAVLNEVESGVMRPNDYVMFNGGSLLKETGTRGGRKQYAVDAAKFAELQAAKQAKNLRIALYVQEPGTSPEAAGALVNLANTQRSVITDGFAWGHLNGRSCPFATGDGLGSQGPLLILDRTKLTAARAKRGVTGAVSRAYNAIVG